jgi:hypothetical protein
MGQGLLDEPLLVRLQDTVDTLEKGSMSGPDLAHHLLALDDLSRNGMSVDTFCRWLRSQINHLKKGKVTRELIRWMGSVMPYLRDIEADIIAYLDNVVDFRFPVSQYKGEISYFDFQLGRLIAALRNHGLYDLSTIVFTSPHGEIIEELDLPFHHHAPVEPVLRSAMVIKPGSFCRIPKRGTRIHGIFDSIDLFPTLMDLLGLPSPGGLAGISRYSNMIDGSDIPEHESYAVTNFGSTILVVEGTNKLIRCLGNQAISPEWILKKGDRYLFDINETPPDFTDLYKRDRKTASRLEAILNRFLVSSKAPVSV